MEVVSPTAILRLCTAAFWVTSDARILILLLELRGVIRMSNTTKSIVIALISAFSAISVAWVTAIGIARKETKQTISASESQIGSLRQQAEGLDKRVAEANSSLSATDIGAMQNRIAGLEKQSEETKLALVNALVRCQPLSSTNRQRAETYSTLVQGSTATTKTALKVTGSGCLIAGGLFGYYFAASPSSRNYTVQVELDGASFAYPDVQEGGAYAMDNGGQNTGVLVFPPLRFSRSLSISYYYPGSGPQVTGYAVVLRD